MNQPEPYPVSANESAAPGIQWDKAFELIPAGHLAAEQINNCSEILPGHELKLIDIDSEACGINVISKGIMITNVYRELVNPNQICIVTVGVIGLFCSEIMGAISPIISHPNIGGYIHIAASASPAHCEISHHSKSSRLFHIIESSSAFNEAMLALMHTYITGKESHLSILNQIYITGAHLMTLWEEFCLTLSIS